MADEQVVGSPEREIHVQALVQLEKIDMSKQEESEDELFKMRAKLYRYFTSAEDGSSWKERGVGEMKIMKHKTKGTYRIVMRRDKTLKLCANHAISSDMEIKPHMGGDKALIWSTPSDYADGEPNPETLCVRFGKPESATEFKKKFEECVRLIKNPESGGDKLADELSSLTVKEEKDDNDNSKISKENGETPDKESKINGETTTSTDEIKNTDNSEKPKD